MRIVLPIVILTAALASLGWWLLAVDGEPSLAAAGPVSAQPDRAEASPLPTPPPEPTIDRRAPDEAERGPARRRRGVERAVAAPASRPGPRGEAEAPSGASGGPRAQPSAAPASQAGDEAALRYSVDREGIRTAVGDSRAQIAECYKGWLKSGASIEGKLVVRFTIEADEAPGAPAHIRDAALVDSELGHPFMEGCVLDVMRGLQFDAPPGGKVTVNYPFVLRESDD